MDRPLHAELLVDDIKVALYRAVEGEPERVVVTCEPGVEVIINGRTIYIA